MSLAEKANVLHPVTAKRYVAPAVRLREALREELAHVFDALVSQKGTVNAARFRMPRWG